MKILLAGPGTGKTTKIKEIVRQHGDGSKVLVLSFTNATVNDLQDSLSEFKISEENCMTLHKFALKFSHSSERHILLPAEIAIIMQISKQTKIDFNRLTDHLSCNTFDQMIKDFVEYINSNPLYVSTKLSGFDMLIIDEYQDFNPNEQSLIDKLVNHFQETYILGDDDQCIYDFKDASSEKIISFYSDNNNEIVPHEHICYRCPDKVVKHSTTLILENKNRVAKTWQPSGKDGDIEFQQFRDMSDIAQTIIQKIRTIPSDESILILSPVRFVAEPIIDLFEVNNIKFSNYFSDTIPFELVYKAWLLRSFFGKYKYLNLVLTGYKLLKSRANYYSIIKDHFNKGANNDDFYRILERKLPNVLKSPASLEEMLDKQEFSELKELFLCADGEDGEEKIENMLREIKSIDSSNIKIMSIHKSKGLGADHVFIIGITEGIMPNSSKGNYSIEAQRRLLYVGITRTKKHCYLYGNIQFDGRDVNTVNKSDFKYDYRSKKYNGKTSRFITELRLLDSI